MDNFQIPISENGTTTLATAGKYCDRNIDVIVNVESTEALPNGYLKVDPTWTSFYMLCNGRPSLAANLKYSDTANGTNFSSMFQSCLVKVIPSLDFRKGTNFSGIFNYSYTIEEIGTMDISSATNVLNMFNGCTGLKRITFAPYCINLSISFANCGLLDDASVQSIVDGLADLTGQTAQKLTFHATVGANMTQAQKDAVSAKNWTLVY